MSTVVDFNAGNAVLVHYRGGAYGNFIFHILSEYLEDTVKVNNDSFRLSNTGNAHQTVKYITTYHLASQLGKIKSYSDYDYQPVLLKSEVTAQIQGGKKFLVLCDTSIVDNHNYLLNLWPNSRMIRTYMPTFLDRLVAYANLMKKPDSGCMCYKNSLFDQVTIDDIATQPGDLDENLVNAMVEVFKQNFNKYGMSFTKPADSPRVYNLNIERLTSWQMFLESITEIANFLNTKVISLEKLKQLYSDFQSQQDTFVYYNYDKNTQPTSDDLIGRSLVKYYQLSNV